MAKSGDTMERFRSSNVASASDVVANRAVLGASQVGLGGTLAAIVTYYVNVPEPIHAHAVALIVFLWNTLVFLVSFFWRRKFGRNGA